MNNRKLIEMMSDKNDKPFMFQILKLLNIHICSTKREATPSRVQSQEHISKTYEQKIHKSAVHYL